jgi:DNA invertase Pin-like site-specific DNA recombinase
MDEIENSMWVHKLWEPIDQLNQSIFNSKRNGIKVAAYCRISNGNNNFTSLENQVSYYTNYIHRHPNWNFVGIYFDNKISGATIKHRPGFKRMIRHAKEGRIELILTKSISRFSRNVQELLEVINQLENTVIYFAAEGIETFKGFNPLLLETHAAMAQDYIENNSNTVKFAYKRRLEKGRPYYGNLYGYDPVEESNKSMVKINEKEAEVVRWIFNEFIQGKTNSEINRALIHKGIKTKKGNDKWLSGQINNIIEEVSYTGDKIALKQTKDIMTGKITPSDQLYLISNSHPAIISRETFNRAQEVLAARKKHHKRSPAQKNPLYKRLVCGRCGNHFKNHNNSSYGCINEDASVKLCEQNRLKRFTPQSMAIKALFKRMMELDVTAYKNLKEISYQIRDGLNRSENQLSSDFLRMLKELEMILKKANQNDHFEFQRLRYFTQVEIAKNLNQTDEVERIKAEYKSFENDVTSIEDDREYRDEALTWIKGIGSINEFIRTSTIEIVRAWVISIEIYSLDSYIVEWIDKETTTIGEDEIPLIKQLAEEKRTARMERLKQIDEPLRLVDKNLGVLQTEKVSDVPRKEEPIVEALLKVPKEGWETKPIKSTIKPIKDVIKLEDGMTIRDLGNLKKNILKAKMANLKEEKEKKLKVAAYCRVSTLQEEQKLSFQTQLAYCNFYILCNPSWVLAGIYADKGVSGTKTEFRDDFNRMIEDAKQGKIDMIITKSISRFSRNVVDVLETIKILHDLDPPVSCYFQKEGLKSNDPQASILLSLMATAAQDEIISLSNNITWGIQSLAQRGIIIRITDIYGYHITKNREWHIVEEEAAVVRLMYQLYAAGKSIYKIIEHLNKKKIPSPNFNEYWDYNTIKQILASEKYIGDYNFQKTYTPSLVGSKPRVNRGQVPQYYIEKHHQPIVDKDIYKKVQKILTQNKREITWEARKGGTAGRELYYQKFYCRECGGLISRYRSSCYDSKEGSIWRCRNSYKIVSSTCNVTRTILEQYLDYNFVLTLGKIKKSNAFRNLMKDYFKFLELKPEEQKHMKFLEEQTEKLNQELYRAVDTQVQKNGQDANQINQITSDIINLRQRLQVYWDRMEKLKRDRERLEKLLNYCEKMKPLSFKKFHHMRPRIKPGDSIYMTTNNARNSSYMDPAGADYFPEDLFREQVISGTIDGDGRIKYKFAEGVEFGVDLTYEEYKELLEKEIEKIQFEELINSSEVIEMKEFCKEGKTPKEIRTHLGITSRMSFDKRILKPLYAAGKLKLERGKASNHWWYSWVEEN